MFLLINNKNIIIKYGLEFNHSIQIIEIKIRKNEVVVII